ncbi:2-dehydropantoate 2-reductase [Oleiagrimonas soli]|uniref:2-dehydropantoate 2-reductase n=1 Tax=Oleiagrimonas soli TaxID=1543381 RepID=A0A099CV58_9GAMM|nr:2-dehydropantoate 2-reductase [Oleiagrimonas soli]KGI76910.1 2-dehydropantoate 2-reductase [Oleiagrimonas soli]MBB6185231.1 2-dehydropantoate 2-reductase [Oleiagrimonas soli]
MKILVIGAGGTGGYFGGRLLAAGRDVTFLVRPKRARLLAERGLRVRSPVGNLDLPAPPTVTADALDRTFDLILLSCKSYDLDSAMEAFAPAVGPDTRILPLLNGMRHLDVLRERFGDAAVLGGLCLISAALDADGRIQHFAPVHTMVFGELDAANAPSTAAVLHVLADAGFDARLSDDIRQDMWEKWVLIASVAGITCLMRASVGDIIAAGAGDLSLKLLEECIAIAGHCGHVPSEAAAARVRKMLSDADSMLMASMLRDVETGSRTEGDHILGDLLRRGGEAAYPVLRAAHLHVRAYEARRERVTKGK